MNRIDFGIKTIRAQRGFTAAVARGLRLTRQSVERWKRIPAEYVFRVGKIIHTPPEHLRPDIFIHDPLRRHNVTQEMLEGVILWGTKSHAFRQKRRDRNKRERERKKKPRYCGVKRSDGAKAT